MPPEHTISASRIRDADNPGAGQKRRVVLQSFGRGVPAMVSGERIVKDSRIARVLSILFDDTIVLSADVRVRRRMTTLAELLRRPIARPSKARANPQRGDAWYT